MKIAFLSDAVYPYNKGGKEKRLFEISTGLAKKGHEVHVYTMKWWKGSKVRKEKGVTLHGISPFYKLYTKKGKRSIKQALMFSLHVFPGLINERFDVLDVDHMPYFPIFPAWLVAKLKGKKLVTSWHEYWGNYWFEYLGAKGIFGYLIEYISIYFSGISIVSSNLTRKRLKKVGKKSVFVPNGFDYDVIKKVKKKGNFDIVFAGRLIKEKNVDLLIDSVKDKYKLGIIGPGPELEKLKEKAKPYPNIKFLGMLPDIKDVYSYMKGAKLFAFPSEREGFGLVVVEAMAAGTPVLVINSKNNASKYLVEKEFVANKNNFGKKINYFMKKIPKLNFNVDKYLWKNIVNKIEEVYLK